MRISTVNIDRPSAPQIVTIEFIRGQSPDENPDLSFLTQDYAGETKFNRLKAKAADQRRLQSYRNEEWYMRGLWVEARIAVPIGQGSFSLYELRSPGLWNVESDCGADYEKQVWDEQETELRAALKAMAPAFAALT